MRKESTSGLLNAKDLVIHLRQLRYHCLLSLGDPTPNRLGHVDEDEEKFGSALAQVKSAAQPGEEQELVQKIEAGYKKFRSDLEKLEHDVGRNDKPRDLIKIADSLPFRDIFNPS